MARDLSSLVVPARTAIVTSELQRGVVGDLSRLPDLAEAARRGPIEATATLCRGARAAGAHVVHCTAFRRADGLGANGNARLFAAMAKLPPMLAGSPDVEVLPELAQADTDVVLSRMHGLSPMAGTDLDAVLRNLGATTVIATGVSVNVAVTNLTFDAVNAGYDVVIPRDAVAGVPSAHVDSMFEHTLALLATITTTREILGAWETD
ncbi:MAG: cysteine hydrolase [Actinobacteria bacterium ATB1]|nr:cysteine hydrolase [Actinobacteria bacterium ATB1]